MYEAIAPDLKPSTLLQAVSIAYNNLSSRGFMISEGEGPHMVFSGPRGSIGPGMSVSRNTGCYSCDYAKWDEFLPALDRVAGSSLVRAVLKNDPETLWSIMMIDDNGVSATISVEESQASFVRGIPILGNLFPGNYDLLLKASEGDTGKYGISNTVTQLQGEGITAGRSREAIAGRATWVARDKRYKERRAALEYRLHPLRNLRRRK